MDPLHGTPSTLLEELRKRVGIVMNLYTFLSTKRKALFIREWLQWAPIPRLPSHQILGHILVVGNEGPHRKRPRPSLRPITESLAQELLDAIIDHVPSPNARSCSLVARRWRKRSPQRHLRAVVFSVESDLARWCRNIPQDPDGIPSYVEDVLFHRICRWSDPAILVRVLKRLSRVKILRFFGTSVPCGKVQSIASSGAFGRELTSLVFICPYSAVSTLMPLISSLQNLRELRIQRSFPGVPRSLAPEHIQIWKRGPLKSLELWGVWDQEAEYIARCGITTRELSLCMSDNMIEKIIACSSETVEKLVLRGAWFLWNSTA